MRSTIFWTKCGRERPSLVDRKSSQPLAAAPLGELVRSAPSADRCVLYLVRHGESLTDLEAGGPSVADRRLKGRGFDLGLAEGGRRQAGAVARTLVSESVDAIYTSPMRRAVETADLLSEALGKKTAERIDAFVEAHLGEWEGRTFREIRSGYPTDYSAFFGGEECPTYPGGESFSDIAERFDSAMDELYRRHRGGRFVVVAHSVVNTVYLVRAMGLELWRALGLRQHHGCINTIVHDYDRTWVETLNAKPL